MGNETLPVPVEVVCTEGRCKMAASDDTMAPGTANGESIVGAGDTSTRAAASVVLNCGVV